MTNKKKKPQDAASIKDDGNKLFAKGEFEQAAKYYEKGIRMLDVQAGKENGSTAGQGDDDVYLKAVCLSNLSNCHFEVGDYEKSVTVAQSCLSVLKELEAHPKLDSEKIQGLYLKNILRMARAYFYGKKVEESIKMLQELSACENQAYAKRAKKMLTQVSQYNKQDDDGTTTKTPEALLQKPVRLTQVSLMEPLVEYYRFGHNVVRSALEEAPNFSGKDEHRSEKIHLKDCLGLDILMAGINDGRHVLATILDVHAQYKALKKKDQRDSVKVSIVCNDIHRASQAKFIVTMVVLHKIGTLAKRKEDIKTNSKASKWCALLQYILLSFAMPPWVKDLAIEAMEEIMAFNSHSAFQKSYPWLQCTSEEDWKKILPILSYWTAQLGGTNHNMHSSSWDGVPDVEDCLGRYFVLRESLDKGLALPPNPSAQAVMRERRAHAESERDAYIQRMSDINNWTPQQKQQMRFGLGPGATDDELVQAYLSTVDDVLHLEDFDDKLSTRKNWLDSPGIQLAHSFLKSTLAILPPSHLSEDSAFSKIYKKDKGRHPRFESDWIEPADVEEAMDIIMTKWSPNPFMFDPLYHTALFSNLPFSPVIDFLNDYMGGEVGSALIPEETKMRAVSNETRKGTQSDPDLKEFFDWTSCFFWNVANALVSLCEESGALEIEWNVGDIVSICQGYCQTGTKRFHRVFLSNIPDYTGVLPVFTNIIPLLQENKPKVSSHLHMDILLNCPGFESYSQYIFSTTALPTITKAEIVLGTKYLGNSDDGTWQEYSWTKPSGTQRRMSKEELRKWLHQLFLLTILPPVRNPKDPIRINYPNNVASFVNTCNFCVEYLRYPSHWVSSVLDELVSATPERHFSTKAMVPSRNPPQPVWSGGKDHKMDISAFTVELRTQMEIIFQQQKLSSKTPLLFSLEACTSSSSLLQQYELTIPINIHPQLDNHNPTFQTMALVLEPTRPDSMDGGDEEEDELEKMMNKMLAMMPGGGPRRTSIRSDILARGSKQFHVLSCLTWELLEFGKSNRLRFCMNARDFDNLQYHYASLLRTDGWFRVGNPILRKAKAIY